MNPSNGMWMSKLMLNTHVIALRVKLNDLALVPETIPIITATKCNSLILRSVYKRVLCLALILCRGERRDKGGRDGEEGGGKEESENQHRYWGAVSEN
jgi:hypothetical protein